MQQAIDAAINTQVRERLSGRKEGYANMKTDYTPDELKANINANRYYNVYNEGNGMGRMTTDTKLDGEYYDYPGAGPAGLGTINPYSRNGDDFVTYGEMGYDVARDASGNKIQRMASRPHFTERYDVPDRSLANLTDRMGNVEAGSYSESIYSDMYKDSYQASNLERTQTCKEGMNGKRERLTTSSYSNALDEYVDRVASGDIKRPGWDSQMRYTPHYVAPDSVPL
jgi:hypothetical protein